MKITGGMIGSAGWILADLVNMFRNEEQQAQYARNKQVVGKIASAGMKIAGAANPEFTKGKPDAKAKAGPPTQEKMPVTPEQPPEVQKAFEAHNEWLKQQKPGYKGPGAHIKGPGGKITTTPNKDTLSIQSAQAAQPQAKLAAGAFQSPTQTGQKANRLLIRGTHPDGTPKSAREIDEEFGSYW